jgi:hypothetical protein
MANQGRKEVQAPTTIMQKPIGTGGCTMVKIDTPTGTRFECRGSCGLFDSFLGRSCGKVVQNAGGGVQVFCTCSGGWWDQIWS